MTGEAIWRGNCYTRSRESTNVPTPLRARCSRARFARAQISLATFDLWRTLARFIGGPCARCANRPRTKARDVNAQPARAKSQPREMRQCADRCSVA